jgi:RNA polymerase sigma-70 factor (ECF subfamily)
MKDATVTDEALMTAVRGGDVAKLGLLFERYHRPLFDFLARMTGDRAAAEDLVQDVFVRVLKYRATYREEGRFETWVFRIARNARADWFKLRGTPETVLDDAADYPAPVTAVDERLARAGDVARLERALLMLRDDKRELIVLARYRGLKHEAIAELLGVEAGAVKVRIHRAVKELREIFLRLSESPSCNVKRSTHSFPTI